MIYKLLFIFIFLTNSLNAYESESKIKVKIISKISKFITWEDVNSDIFTIAVLNNPYGTLFDDIFRNKKIKNKKVRILYISNIDELQNCDILYISSKDSKNIEYILEKSKNKSILTVSDMRGFADRKGILQLSFTAQKVKLKINLVSAREENLKISSSLLRMAEVIKE